MTQRDVVLKDSGARRDFGTGSVRDVATGKGRYDLLPTRAIFLVARQFEEGAKKYGERNWEKGQPLSVYLDSAIRHALNHLQGKRDERHDIAAAWNMLALLETQALIEEGVLPPELDNLAQPVQPKYGVNPAHAALKSAIGPGLASALEKLSVAPTLPPPLYPSEVAACAPCRQREAAWGPEPVEPHYLPRSGSF